MGWGENLKQFKFYTMGYELRKIKNILFEFCFCFSVNTLMVALNTMSKCRKKKIFQRVFFFFAEHAHIKICQLSIKL